MFMNRKGNIPSWAIFLIIVLAIYLLVPSFQMKVNGLFGGTTTPDINTGLSDTSTCPTSGITTLTLNVQDELATTATNVDTQYYVFNGQKLLSEGVTGSDGSTSVDVNCGKNLKLVLLNATTGSGAGGYYTKIIDYNARIASDTLNAELIKIGGVTTKVINENYVDTGTDVNTNMTLAASQTKAFKVKIEANGTTSGYNYPIVLCQANITSIQTMTLASWSDGTPVTPLSVPARISATTGYRYYAWGYDKMLLTQNGPVTGTGSITATTTAPGTADTITCKTVDRTYWKISSYKTATSPEQAFLFGPENTESIGTDVGGTDSSTATINIGTEAN